MPGLNDNIKVISVAVLCLKPLIMNINFPIVGLVIAAAVILIIFLIRRNFKDGKKFEKELNKLDEPTEKHDSGESSL